MPVYCFAGLRLDPGRMEITGPDGSRAAEPQVLDVLCHLVENRGRLVTREDLLDAVWGDRFVSDSALSTRIKQARRLVGDDGTSQALIRTVHGRGYRFVAEVTIETGSGEPVGGPEPGDGPTTAASADAGQLPPELASADREAFVGRAEEADLLMPLFEGPVRAARWIVLRGEPGIGKTRLAARVAGHAAEHGWTVLYGRCSEDLAVPYQPVIEALRTVIAGRDPAALRELLGPAGGELARLLPELVPRVPGLVAPSSADAETERYRLFEGTRGWLAATVRRGPLLVVVDDLHWGTASTVQMLTHLARTPLSGPLCVLLTLRDTSSDPPEGLVALIDHLVADPAARVLSMAGLDLAAAVQLLGPRDELATMVGETAGNPLLLQAMAAAGGGDVTAAVRRRTSELPPRVHRTLTGAAVAGAEFAVSVLAAALGVDELDLVDDLDRAVTARLLDDTGGDTYRFTHALVRDALRASLTRPRRARLHARIGVAMERVYAGHLTDVAPEIAFHLGQAAAADPAASACGRAPAGRGPPGGRAALLPRGHRAPPARPRPA